MEPRPVYDEPLPPRRTRLPRLSLLVAGLGAVIGVAAFGAAVASGGQPSSAGLAIPLVSNASPVPGTGPGAGPRGAAGWMAPGGMRAGRGFMMNDITITAINGSSLSLKTADGWTRTIDASGATVTRAGQTVALSTLRVGDQIVFRETRQSDGSVRIDSITVVLPQVNGTVSSIDASSITVKQPDGTSKTVTLTSSTTYRSGGQVASAGAVVSGARVDIQGQVAADGTFTATVVNVAPSAVGGTVSAKSGDTITVRDRAGTSMTVRVTSSTTFQVKGVTNATIADIAVGDAIQAQGTHNADGSITATIVRAGAAGQFGQGPMMRGPGMRGPWGAGGQGPAPADPRGVPGSNGGTGGTTGA
jgi:Domain of unknown function (DUF5666)